MLKLYNTLTRKKEEFRPLKHPEGIASRRSYGAGKKVGIYSCGPTVYWNQHIGNMYAYVQWDAMVRFLKYAGYKTKWVINITDVGHLTSDEDTGEDKMEKGAKREGLSIRDIAKKYISQFLESANLLNIQRPDVLCRATEHIKEQIELIKKIEKNGFAYKTKTGLVFDTSKFPDYEKFARLNLEKQFAGARVKVDPEKKKPWDFLLWVTNQPQHIMQWNSPWGRGFPGWHIECTAMSTKYLGKQFDIHTGGKEHVPVHHTNEIAQSFGAFGKQIAKYWLHNEWLLIDEVKVSKSLGNIVLVQDFVKKGIDPLAFRYLVLTSHYRQGLNFTWQALQASQTALNKLREKMIEFGNDKTKIKKENIHPVKSGSAGLAKREFNRVKKYQQKFAETIENDLNFPQVIALTWQMIKDKKLSGKEKYSLLLNFDKVFGLNLKEFKSKTIPAEIKKLAKERETARKQKNWQKADEIRLQIEKQGFTVEDTKDGPQIQKLS